MMDSLIKLQLEAGERVIAFSDSHPTDIPGIVEAVDRLRERVARAGALDTQYRTGVITVESSVLTKTDLRVTIRDGIAMLADLAQAAVADKKDLPIRIRTPRLRSEEKDFLSASRIAIAQAQENSAILTRYGLTPTLLDELSAATSQLESARGQKDVGRNAHTGATADLDRVAADVSRILRQLHKLNRVRFKGDTETLTVWNRVRRIPRPSRGQEKPTDPTAASK